MEVRQECLREDDVAGNCLSGRFGAMSTWDVSAVTDMSYMFHNADAFNGDLSSWDVSAVTDMSSMFYDADAFNGDVSSWDVSAVTSMSLMFWDAEACACFHGPFAADCSGCSSACHASGDPCS